MKIVSAKPVLCGSKFAKDDTIKIIAGKSKGTALVKSKSAKRPTVLVEGEALDIATLHNPNQGGRKDIHGTNGYPSKVALVDNQANQSVGLVRSTMAANSCSSKKIKEMAERKLSCQLSASIRDWELQAG